MGGAADGEPLARADPGGSRRARGTVRPLARLGHPPDTGGLAEGEAAPVEGRNDFGMVGYRGPCPPRGRGPHRYRFRLHALAEELGLAPGAGVAELERALTASLLSVAELVGTYER
jgi:Raf kinase inhibitor-like YbhB/YbcL family protein